MRLPSILMVLALVPACVHAYDSLSPEADGISRYTFAWPLGEGMLKPRGASAKGAPVTLDRVPTDQCKHLHAPGLGKFARDRHTILVMAGPYRASFDCMEVARFDPTLTPDARYQSWGPSMSSSARIAGISLPSSMCR